MQKKQAAAGDKDTRKICVICVQLCEFHKLRDLALVRYMKSYRSLGLVFEFLDVLAALYLPWCH